MNKLADFIGRITGWDEEPARVFIIAVPLAIVGFGCMIAMTIMSDNTVMKAETTLAAIVLVFCVGNGLRNYIKVMRANERCRKALEAWKAEQK